MRRPPVHLLCMGGGLHKNVCGAQNGGFMKITTEIVRALERAIEHYGNVSQFAKSVGLAHSTILFWQSGKTTSISGNVWANKLRPALLPFMAPKSNAPSLSLEEEALIVSASNQILSGLRTLIKLEMKRAADCGVSREEA